MHTTILFALLLGGCKDKGDDTAALTGDLVFTDATNYTYTGSLDVPLTTVNELTDATVDWSGLTEDIRGREVVPSEIDQLTLVAFVDTREEVLAAIASNSLAQSSVADFRLFTNADAGTTALLSEFAVLGNYFDPAEDLAFSESKQAWAVLVQQERDERMDIESLTFLDLVASGGSDTITIGNDSAALDFQATLGEDLETRAGLSYTLDWSGLTVDGGGQPFDPLRADRLFLGHVSYETDAEIEAGFISLLEDADALYTMDVYAETYADLSLAVAEDGSSFPGFSEGGSWLVGVECTVCPSPAPVMLARVQVR